jgi:phosphoglycerate kinase
MTFKTLDDIDVRGKRALVRVDFNVPMNEAGVADDTRLRAALPTIDKLRAGGARVILFAHFDRPKGKRVASMSLAPVVAPLAALVGAPVIFADDCIGGAASEAIAAMADGDILLLENLRFHAGEEANDPAFTADLAGNGDLYVNDAFSAAHRAHASTEGLARHVPAYAGEAMRRELEALEAALGNPKRPVLGIVGGSKVSTKLDLLKNLVQKLDALAIGGGMANTFLHAQGHDVAASFCEKDLADTAREIMSLARDKGCELLLPIDVVVAERMEAGWPGHRREADLRDGRLAHADLERPARRLRDPAVRPGDDGRRAPRRQPGQRRRADRRRRRRRHGRGPASRRRDRRFHLRIDRRRRLSGMDGRQDPARRGGFAIGARQRRLTTISGR